MFQFAEKPLSVFQVYKQSFALYKETFSKVWYVLIINLAIINLIQLLLPSVNIAAGTNAVSSITKESAGQICLYAAISITLSMYFAAVVIHRIYNLANSTNIIAVSSYTFVLRKIIYILLTFLIVFTLVILGFVLWIPGIIFLFLFLFYLAAILFEGKRMFSAIKRSCQLVWGNWWRTFNVMMPVIVVGLLFMVAMLLLFKAIGIAWLIVGMFFAFFVVVSPLFFSIYLVQYNDLKVRNKPTI